MDLSDDTSSVASNTSSRSSTSGAFCQDREDGDVLEEKYSFRVLTTEQIVQDMVDCIDETNGVMQLPRTTMRILLNHYDWDKEKLLDSYFDAGNSDLDKLFNEAGVINPVKAKANKPSVCKTLFAEVEDCKICFTEKSSSMYAMDCGHRFCVPCWRHYLTSKIMEEGMGQTIPCPGIKCPILVPDATVIEIVSDSEVRLKYQQLITNSYVQKNRLLRFCPAADCSNAIRVDYVDWKPVTCECSHVFCFQCGNDWHDPVQCQWLSKWIKFKDGYSPSMSVDQGSLLWIAANTKECPKCKVTIEKNGGCNHMTCSNNNCNHEFCWVCLGNWRGYGAHSCNVYDDPRVNAAKQMLEKYEAALKRFKFYGERYANHQQSFKFEKGLYEKMEELREKEYLTLGEVDFVKKAVDILCQCRLTLSYTYVFAFFLKETNQSRIFEDNQKDLETATEILSEYLERDITAEKLADIKQQVQNKSSYCEGRRKVLVDHVYEGYDQDWWQYNED